MRRCRVPTIHHPVTDEPLLESSDAGRALDVTAKEIHRLTDRGILTPVARTVRGSRLYRPSDVEALRVARQNNRRG
jgi:DNA-binding transcriptional MerR regulator